MAAGTAVGTALDEADEAEAGAVHNGVLDETADAHGGLLLCGVVVVEHGLAELAGLGLVAPREGFAGIAEGPEGLLLGDLGGEAAPEDIEMVGEVLEVGGGVVGVAEGGHEDLAETAAVQGVTGEIALQGVGGVVGVRGALQEIGRAHV